MKEQFKDIIVSNQNRLSNLTIWPRSKGIDTIPTRITSLVGARRSGKTYYLYQLIENIVRDNAVSGDQILYINFEDDRLFPFNHTDFDVLIKAFYELYPQNKQKHCWFFLDEIQEIEHWEKFVRRLHDTEDAEIVLTGSSSTLLSKELATTLRGRSISYEIFPFSYKEYVQTRHGKINSLYDSEQQAQLKYLLNEYLSDGGFPETIGLKKNQKLLLWQDYVDLILYRDLIERHNISNTYLIKYFLKFLLQNQGNLLSINKVYKDFKSQGISVSRATLFDYLHYAEDAFILFAVKKWSNNLREQQRNPMKVYTVDIGLKRAMSHSVDSGRALENLVYLELRREYKEIYYWKGKKELDFLIPKDDGFILINVCESLRDMATRSREIDSLNEAMNHFGLPKSLLLTMDEEEIIETEKGVINVQPVWKWCLRFEN